jgi:hypothetical protein
LISVFLTSLIYDGTSAICFISFFSTLMGLSDLTNSGLTIDLTGKGTIYFGAGTTAFGYV